jgi:two-component system, chemotaxis family, response regulator Rcp1
MSNRGAQASILIVEDNPADVRLIRDGIAETNASSIRLTVAPHGEAAMALLRQSTSTSTFPSLILLDLNLPGKNGNEVLTEIKRDERFRTIPVIIFTSSVSERDVETAYACGANVYLRKPTNLDEFFALLKSVVNLWFNFAILPNGKTGYECH